MTNALVLEGVGVRFSVPRHTRAGRKPSLSRSNRHSIWGLKDIGLSAARGEIVGIIGTNGAGKTSLLRTVAGIYRPDEGTLQVTGGVAPVLSVSGGLKPELSGWENVVLSLTLMGCPRDEARQAAPRVAALSGLGDFLDAEVRVYSAGMKTRLGFALALLAPASILVIDEVIGAADHDYRGQIDEMIREFAGAGGTILMASHDLESMAHLCNRLVELNHGRLIAEGKATELAEDYLRRHSSPKPKPQTENT